MGFLSSLFTGPDGNFHWGRAAITGGLAVGGFILPGLLGLSGSGLLGTLVPIIAAVALPALLSGPIADIFHLNPPRTPVVSPPGDPSAGLNQGKGKEKNPKVETPPGGPKVDPKGEVKLPPGGTKVDPKGEVKLPPGGTKVDPKGEVKLPPLPKMPISSTAAVTVPNQSYMLIDNTNEDAPETYRVMIVNVERGGRRYRVRLHGHQAGPSAPTVFTQADILGPDGEPLGAGVPSPAVTFTTPITVPARTGNITGDLANNITAAVNAPALRDAMTPERGVAVGGLGGGIGAGGAPLATVNGMSINPGNLNVTLGTGEDGHREARTIVTVNRGGRTQRYRLTGGVHNGDDGLTVRWTHMQALGPTGDTAISPPVSLGSNAFTTSATTGFTVTADPEGFSPTAGTLTLNASNATNILQGVNGNAGLRARLLPPPTVILPGGLEPRDLTGTVDIGGNSYIEFETELSINGQVRKVRVAGSATPGSAFTVAAIRVADGLGNFETPYVMVNDTDPPLQLAITPGAPGALGTINLNGPGVPAPGGAAPPNQLPALQTAIERAAIQFHAAGNTHLNINAPVETAPEANQVVVMGSVGNASATLTDAPPPPGTGPNTFVLHASERNLHASERLSRTLSLSSNTANSHSDWMYVTLPSTVPGQRRGGYIRLTGSGEHLDYQVRGVDILNPDGTSFTHIDLPPGPPISLNRAGGPGTLAITLDDTTNQQIGNALSRALGRNRRSMRNFSPVVIFDNQLPQSLHSAQ
jgi:hypothetical protein